MSTEKQIEELTRRVQRLELEMSRLQKQQGDVNQLIQNSQSVKSSERNLISPSAESQPISRSAHPSVQWQPVLKSVHPFVELRQGAKPVQRQKQDSDIESKIGKNVMAILASVLIFFSFILFAGMFYKYIPDSMKTALMFAISMIISVVGISRMSKPGKYSTLFSSLAGCGAGALYITCMIAYFVFHLMDESVLAILILIWLIFTIVMSKIRSVMFAYICNIGLIVATFLSAFQWTEFPIGIILYFTILSVLYLMNHSELKLDFIYLIQVPFVMLGLEFIYSSPWIGFSFFLLSIAELLLIYFRYQAEDKNTTNSQMQLILSVVLFFSMLISYIFTSINHPDLFMMLYNSYEWDRAMDIMELTKYLFCITAIGFCVAYYRKYFKKNSLMFFTWYALTVIFATNIFLATGFGMITGLLPVFVLLLVIGIALDNIPIRCSGYIIAFLYQFHFPDWGNTKYASIYLGFICLAVILAAAIKFRSHRLDKYWSTFLVMSYVLCIWGYYYSYVEAYNLPHLPQGLLYIVFALISALMNTKYYCTNLRTGEYEKSSEMIGYVFNAIMVFVSLFCITLSRDSTIDFVLYTLGSIAVFCVNARRIFRLNFSKFALGIYNCAKFSLLIWTILIRWGAKSYMISIAGIVVAITCICLGFMKHMKAFRVYGLMLTMVCICKLILADFYYDVNMLKPVGFFVAGILCFGISWIYSKLEKQLYSESKENEKA